MSVSCSAVPTSRLVALPLRVWSTSASVMTNQIMLQISMSSIDLPSSSSSRAIASRHCPRDSGVSWMPIQPDRLYLATRLAERLGSLSPLKKIGGCGFLGGVGPHPPRAEGGDSPRGSHKAFFPTPRLVSILSRPRFWGLGEKGGAPGGAAP